FRNGRRYLAASHRLRGARQRAQRAVDAEHDQPRAHEGDRQNEKAPSDPLGRLPPFQAGAGGARPEDLLVDGGAHPTPRHAVPHTAGTPSRAMVNWVLGPRLLISSASISLRKGRSGSGEIFSPGVER